MFDRQQLSISMLIRPKSVWNNIQNYTLNVLYQQMLYKCQVTKKYILNINTIGTILFTGWMKVHSSWIYSLVTTFTKYVVQYCSISVLCPQYTLEVQISLNRLNWNEFKYIHIYCSFHKLCRHQKNNYVWSVFQRPKSEIFLRMHAYVQSPAKVLVAAACKA